MADVFLAVARGPVGFNKLVVLQRLRAHLGDEATFRDMFLDEARLAARLSQRIRAQRVLPLGSKMPVGSNATRWGRDPYRRVDVGLGND